MAVINLVISVVLCRQFGGIGCAFGTAVSIIVANIVIMNIYYHKKLKINIIRFWREELSFSPSIITLVIIGLVIRTFVPINGYVAFIFCGLVFIIVYLISLWLFSLNQNEKNMIRSTIQKIRK